MTEEKALKNALAAGNWPDPADPRQCHHFNKMRRLAQQPGQQEPVPHGHGTPNRDSHGRAPDAPAWDGNLRDLTDAELKTRDRGLMLHISAVLVSYNSVEGEFTPTRDLAKVTPWLQRLAEVRNESHRRERREL